MPEDFVDDTAWTPSNACAALDEADRQILAQAATRLLDAKGITIKVAEQIGGVAAWAGRMLPRAISSKVEAILYDMLWDFQSGAMAGLDKDAQGDRWGWLHKTLGLVSGATGGLAGLPGLIWDIPVTTTMIMRSVADIARSFPGEDITADDTRRACIEVFAMGSPLQEDDEADFGYWAARAGLSRITDATVQRFIRVAASRFGIAVSDKLLAQAVPVIGGVMGATLNYAFIDYYQEMARVHFAVRDVERRAADPSAIRPCLAEIVQAARSRRGLQPGAERRGAKRWAPSPQRRIGAAGSSRQASP
ncbi:MAG TPA: EcsC family protein [Rhodopila sp.]|nr:EcsC family protein [Rhodopila sp.]